MCGALSSAPNRTTVSVENSRRAIFASRNAAVCTRFVPRCGAPLICVPTTNSIRFGRAARTRGRSRSTERSSAFARMLFGEMSSAGFPVRDKDVHAPRPGLGRRRLAQMKSSRAAAESAATNTGW
ncbi:hypothetical protein LV75_003540 [Actinokineospora diospyrosa]|uniref:Uncharacterized protein n=1 Tax=Actinokineospora diospyrosa TaxID=103728 RepID=A0ABT1IEG8_9PSEU|nr:hypothetical protein [Actinokineospora diospyrosa]